ncbi:alpha/beta-hydrolase [Microthyrium microscopicum]|uniref:Carboxylic ester hydrolase n=1 Tax=Microthyrium microscopicum TaxID=703497 RepID=A0A6A6U5D9_9PEZI|nr:alpha/beta-hydrolase [Microthyrium microscopicum]
MQIVLLLAAAIACVNAAPAWTIGQEVKTSSGAVKGRAATRPGFSDVSEYVGIPYAAPPVGDLRWMPPKSFTAAGPIDATKWKDDCSVGLSSGGTASGGIGSSPLLAAYGGGMGGGNHTFSEDCLGLNIWTKPQTGEKAKAVLLWVHGGAFSTGTPHATYMDGSRFAEEQDVILVSISYRINIMGFPDAPGIPAQNLGLHDLRLALEWVRDNIANFGGDPKRITIFGESAGGAAVDLYSYGWAGAKDPIINGIIAQSGSAGTRAGGQAKVPNKAWYDVSQKIGCGGLEAGEKTVACMRGKSAVDIEKIIGSMSAGMGLGASPFGPVSDGKTVFADVADRGAKGNFIKVPLVIGNTDHEAGLTDAFMAAAGVKAPAGAAPKSGPGSNLPPGVAEMLPKDLTPRQIADSMSSCASAKASEYRVKAGVPAWRFRYMGVWDNTNVGPDAGAYHSSDVPFVFGTTELRSDKIKDSPEEAKAVKATMTAWATFAKDPVNGLVGLGWPKYDAANTLVRIAYNNQSALNVAPAATYDVVCKAINSIAGS